MTDLKKLSSLLDELKIKYKIEERNCLFLTIINGWNEECPISFQLDGSVHFLNKI